MIEPGSHEIFQPSTITLSTPRLTLRTLCPEDAQALRPLLSQTPVMKWTKRGTTVQTLPQAERWVSTRALGKDVFNFVVSIRETGEVIGVMGSFHPPQVGYLIRSDHAGNGYATEALVALIPALFLRMPPASEGGTGHDYIEALTDSENVGSMRVLEKCGFTRCATLQNDFESAGLPGVRDTVVFRLARPGKMLAKLGLLPESELDTGSVFVPPIE